MSAAETAELFSVGEAPTSPDTGGVGPLGRSLPVRLGSGSGREDRHERVGGSGNLVAADGGHEPGTADAEPDAVGRGWVTPPGGTPVEALFVLAGSSLGIGRTERVAAPVWLDLGDLVNLDAIGDPVDGLNEVEISMADGTVIGAGWTDGFCEAVLAVLTAAGPAATATAADAPAAAPEAATFADDSGSDPSHSPLAAPGRPDVRFDEIDPTSPTAAAPTPEPTEGDAVSPDTGLFTSHAPATEQLAAPVDTDGDDGGTGAGGVFSAQPVVRNRSRRSNESAESAPSTGDLADVPVTDPGSGSAADGDEASTPPTATSAADTVATPAPAATGAPAPPRAGALELEDVVYLGGYPGQTRRRKKCTAVLTHDGLEVAGPGDLSFRIAWDSVKTVEAQNSDEARFRMNTKIHRDSSALVVECDQSVTVLLEARDCPTIPLRSAITQLLVDLPVVVV